MQTKLQMENIIYKVIVGSHAYGTNVEGSDMDIKGIYIQSPEDVLERGYQEQVTVNKDEVYYEIRRFVELACGGNPTVLELLWSPPDCVLYKHEIMDRLLENRTGFLSKSCRHSFGGYAFAQIDKARGLNKKMNWEASRVTRKNILDFCYVIQNGKSHSLKEWLETQPPHYRDQSKWGAAKINNARDLYCIYPDQDNGYHGLVNSDETSNELRLSSIPEERMTEGVVMSYNKDGYMEHCKDYLSYQKWLQERNTQRYVDVAEHGQKIDGKNLLHCYRLIETGIEIAREKTVNVRRPNREFLVGIRKGHYNLEELLSRAEGLLQDLNTAFQQSDLPDKVDRGFYLSLVVKIRKEYYQKELSKNILQEGKCPKDGRENKYIYIIINNERISAIADGKGHAYKIYDTGDKWYSCVCKPENIYDPRDYEYERHYRPMDF